MRRLTEWANNSSPKNESIHDNRRWGRGMASHIAYRCLVQSLNSPFFPPHIGAEPGRVKREFRINYMRMLRTNQSQITRPLSMRAHTTLPFPARVLKKKRKSIFFDVDIVVRNKLKSDLSWFVLLSATSTRHYSFSEHFFFNTFSRESLTRTSSSFA